MSTNLKSVVVLLPTGHRQTMKVQLDTSILQILEDVCKKNGLKSEEYDLRHHSQILDPTSVVRFSSLPNNAFLEMVPCREQRKEAVITLSIQIDSQSERLNGSFMPTVDLETVLKTLCPNVLEVENKVPVVVFMRREIAGIEKLQLTTLHSLGITSGRVLFRVTTRDSVNHPSLQSTGSAILPSNRSSQSSHQSSRSERPSRISNDSEDRKSESPVDDKDKEHESITVILKTSPKLSKKSVTIEDNADIQEFDVHSHNSNEIKSFKNEEGIPANKKVIETLEQQDKRMEKTPESTSDRLASAGESKNVYRGNNLAGPTSANRSIEKFLELDISDLKYLDDERKSLLFPLKDSSSGFEQDIPDEFFDITVDDVRLMMRDLKRTREEMENSPMLTESQREEIHRRKSEQYKQAIVRIQFPDRLVLQGVFKPTDSISVVLEHVKQHLKDPNMEFYLYTSPPKRILLPEETLTSTGCIPCAKIYFGISSQSQDDMKRGFLHEKLTDSMTSQSIASIAACHIRGLRPNTGLRREAAQDSSAGCGSSDRQSVQQHSTEPQKKEGSLSKEKVPKWFKPV